jgi:hypothetical protein
LRDDRGKAGAVYGRRARARKSVLSAFFREKLETLSHFDLRWLV